jgi:hypothetical protein
MNNLGDISVYIMNFKLLTTIVFLKGKIDIVNTINLNVAIQEIRVIKHLNVFLKELHMRNTNNKISKLAQVEKN